MDIKISVMRITGSASILIAIFLLLAGKSLPAAHPSSLQNNQPFEIDFIRDSRIKVDGSYMQFTYDTTRLDNPNFIYVYVANTNRGFFQVKGQKDYVYVKKTKRVVVAPDKAYKDYFYGQGYSLVLDIRKTAELNGLNVYVGSLQIKDKSSVLTLRVHGLSDF
jgi:hypothetical protein